MIYEYGVVDGVTLIVDTDGLGVGLVEDISAGAEDEVAELGVVVVEVTDIVEERRRCRYHVGEYIDISVVGLDGLTHGGVVEHDMSHYLSLASQGVDADGDILAVPHHQAFSVVHIGRGDGDVGDMAVADETHFWRCRLAVVVVGDDEERAHLVLPVETVVDTVALKEAIHRREVGAALDIFLRRHVDNLHLVVLYPRGVVAVVAVVVEVGACREGCDAYQGNDYLKNTFHSYSVSSGFTL